MNAMTAFAGPVSANAKRFRSRGLAARHLLRAPAAAFGIEVPRAALQNGLLETDLAHPLGPTACEGRKKKTGGL